MSISRSAVAVTPINTGIFSDILDLNSAAEQAFLVEIDGATGTFYVGSGFHPIGGTAAADYRSTMGFLLSIMWFVSATQPAAGAEVRVEQQIDTSSPLAFWTPIRSDLVVTGVPYIQRAIPISASLARVRFINNDPGQAIAASPMCLRVTSL